MPKEVLNNEQKDWVVREYTAGRSMRDIAREAYVGENTVRRILIQRDIPRRPKKGCKINRPTDPKENAFIVAMYERGWNMRQLSEMLGLGHGTIHNRLKILGIKRRTQSEAQRLYHERLKSAKQREQ